MWARWVAVVVVGVGCGADAVGPGLDGGPEVFVPEVIVTDVEIAPETIVVEDAREDAVELEVVDTPMPEAVDDTTVGELAVDDTSVPETVEETSVPDTVIDIVEARDVIDAVEAVEVLEWPLVRYVLGGQRRLLFLNNPEQLVDGDLGDADLGDKTLYRVTVGGANRSFFEHVNRTGRTLGFGVQVYNPGPATVRVTVVAVGYVTGILGGAPFADALSGRNAAAALELAAGRSTWIVRKDESIPVGAFFSGVVDFDVVGGEVIVNHIAYDSFAALDGSTTELDYVQRVEPDGTHEARMYKGVATASEAALETLAWVLEDATSAGPLPVRVMRYDRAAGYAPPTIANAWVSHIGPAQNGDATTSDLVAFVYRAWRFDALVDSDGEGRPANLGNWGVIYRTPLRIDNRGARARRVAYTVTASPGAGAVLASRAGGAWSHQRIEKGVTVELGALVVPAGEMRELVVEWVLGGPAGGGIVHRVVCD